MARGLERTRVKNSKELWFLSPGNIYIYKKKKKKLGQGEEKDGVTYECFLQILSL